MEIEEIKELQEKLYQESSELSDKIIKLDNTIHSFNSLEKFTVVQLNLLEVQLMSMKTYFRILRARIEDFQDQIIRLENANERKTI